MISSADDPRSRAREEFPGGTSSPDSEDCEHAADGPPAAENPLDPLIQQIAAIRRSAANYFEAQKDWSAAAIRRAIAKAILGTMAAIVGVTLLVTCTVLFTSGLADVIGIAAGGRLWIGKLITGGVVLMAAAILSGAYISKWMRSAHAKTVHKYESRYDARRKNFDADAHRRQDKSNRTV
jgi:hypothetical protein